MIFRIAVREIGVSRNHGVSLRPPWNLSDITEHYGIEGFKGKYKPQDINNILTLDIKIALKIENIYGIDITLVFTCSTM